MDRAAAKKSAFAAVRAVSGGIQNMGWWPKFWRQRRFWLAPDPHARILSVICTQALLVVFLIVTLLFTPLLWQLLDEQIAPEIRAQVAGEMLILHRRFWPALIGGLVVGVFMVLRISQRIAGPRFRFRQILNELGTGPTPQAFRLRKGDLLQQDAELINRALDRLRRKEQEQDQILESLYSLFRRLEAEGREDLVAPLSQFLRPEECELLGFAKVEESLEPVH